MKLNTRLLAGAAVGLIAIAGADGAMAKAKHPAKRAPAAAPASEVQELREQVKALESRLAAQEQAQQQLQAQAQQAQADARSAAAEAHAAEQKAAMQIDTIPGVVDTAIKAKAPKPGWEANTQVNGRMYFDLTNIDQKKDGTRVSPTGTGFDIKRFYVGIDHKFNDTFSANVTTDVAYVSADGLTQVYIKKAYLQAKVNDMLTVRFGSADLPWIPYAEDMYGYRFVENTIADRTKYGTSADWGVHALGKVGIFNYAAAIVNGGGYKNPTRTKGMDFEGRISTNLNGLNLAVGGYSGELGKDVKGAPTHHRAERLDALAAYVQPKFRIGAEYFYTRNWNNVTTVATDTSDGVSVFGNYNFTKEISAFGRYDYVKPSKDLKSNEKDNYFNIGVNWEPVKIVDLALVYKRDKVDNGLLSTSNGTIGGLVKGTYDEIGLWGQLRW